MRSQRDSLTEVHNRQSVVVRAQAEEEEQGGEPNTKSEECSYLGEAGDVMRRRVYAVGGPCFMSRILRDSCEVEEPQKVINYDEHAGGNEGE